MPFPARWRHLSSHPTRTLRVALIFARTFATLAFATLTFATLTFATLAFATLAFATLGALPAVAQDAAGDTGSGEELGDGETGELGTGEADLEAIEDLLAQDESVLVDPESYSYDPGSRRDPFRSLIEARDTQNEATQDRPEGKAGLLIDEIVVEGVFELGDGPVAQVQSAREETSYLLRPGDQLWDGDVISINLEEVVFKQVVDDPTALRPFREVVKRLSP